MSSYPKNIGIIMDGNRRWASKVGVPYIEGHRKGAKVLKKIISFAGRNNISELTVFAFSTENWKRSDLEVKTLINLFEWFIKAEIVDINSNNVLFRSIGDKEKFPKSLRNLLLHAETITKKNEGLRLNIALNYGGKADIIYAAKNIAHAAVHNRININNLDERLFSNYLYSQNISDFDLIIRTSGEQRLSNFMLWQSSYSEVFLIPPAKLKA